MLFVYAAIGFKFTTTGDTICDEQHPVILESMEFPEPVIDIAIEPKTKAGQDKMGEALAKLAEEDPTFRVSTNKETGQTIIAGMGELHLEIIVDRLLREFKVEANVGKPQMCIRDRVGVVATTATIESSMYTKALKACNPKIQVYGKACPLLVPLVEEGWIHDSITEEVVNRYIKDMEYKSIDTLILGCTHYPLLRSTFRRVVGENVILVNPAYETAMELGRVLEKLDLSCDEQVTQAGEKYEFFVSDAEERFCAFANSILPYDIEAVKQVNIEEENE